MKNAKESGANGDMPAQAVSAESGKSVERFDFTEDGMEHDFYGKYVRHEDYAKLEQQRDALVKALKPFAKLQLKPGWHDDTPTAVLVTVGDINRAHAALRAAGVVLS